MRAQVKHAAGVALAERRGFGSLAELSAHAAACPAEEKAALLAELNEAVGAVQAKRHARAHARGHDACARALSCSRARANLALYPRRGAPAYTRSIVNPK